MKIIEIYLRKLLKTLSHTLKNHCKGNEVFEISQLSDIISVKYS